MPLLSIILSDGFFTDFIKGWTECWEMDVMVYWSPVHTQIV